MQRCRQSGPSGPAHRRQAGADDVSPPHAGPRQAAPDRAGAARKGLWHLADHHLGRPGAGGAAHCLRPARSRHGARRPCGGRRREPAAPVRLHAGRAVAGRGAGAAVPGRGDHGICLPDQQRRGALRHRRGPGTGRQDDRGARELPAAAAHLVRRPARPAQLQRTRAGGAGRADRGRPRLRHRARRLLRRRGGPRPAAGRGGDVLHQRHHRQPQGRGAHALHAARPRRRGPALRQADRKRSGWPAATWSIAPSRPRR